MMKETLVYLSEHYRIICYNAQHEHMIVSFDVWRKDRSGFPKDNPSTFFHQSNVAHLVIHSSQNDWFLNPDIINARQHLSMFIKPYKRVTAFGFSMGGYGALLFSRAIRVNQVVLVSPQISIFPSQVPFENRYLEESRLVNPKYDTIAANPRKGLRGVILFDPSITPDRKHADIITDIYPKIWKVPLTFGGHPALLAINQAGLFGKIQKELLRNRVRPSEILRLHKLARKVAPVYRENIRAYLYNRDIRVCGQSS